VGSETKELHEHALAIDVENNGPDGYNVAISNFNLALFYHHRAVGSQTNETKKENLELSQFKYKEAARIYNVIYGPNNPESVTALSQSEIISLMLTQCNLSILKASIST
jgi:hypothetical protein